MVRSIRRYIGVPFAFLYIAFIEPFGFIFGLKKLGPPESWVLGDLRKEYGMRRAEVATGLMSLCFVVAIIVAPSIFVASFFVSAIELWVSPLLFLLCLPLGAKLDEFTRDKQDGFMKHWCNPTLEESVVA